MDPDFTAALHTLGLDRFVPIFLLIHAICSLLDALVPQPAAGSHWLPVRKAITVLALNVGHAQDQQQPSVVSWLQRIVVLLAEVVPGAHHSTANPVTTEPAAPLPMPDPPTQIKPGPPDFIKAPSTFDIPAPPKT